jgi:hypothetical protein
MCRRLGGPQGQSGQVRQISPTSPTGIRFPDRPGRSQSLCRLIYRAMYCIITSVKKIEHNYVQRIKFQIFSDIRSWLFFESVLIFRVQHLPHSSGHLIYPGPIVVWANGGLLSVQSLHSGRAQNCYITLSVVKEVRYFRSTLSEKMKANKYRILSKRCVRMQVHALFCKFICPYAGVCVPMQVHVFLCKVMCP